VLSEIDAAVARHRVVSTLPEVWYQAGLGRGDLLVVEEGYHEAGRINARGHLDLRVDDPAAPDVLDDAVDEVITLVLDRGGHVAFVDDGDLALHDRIALTLRY
jgi:hypothetical protein